MRGTWVQISLLLLGLSLTEGYLFFGTEYCVFNSSDPGDVTFLMSMFYNKLELLRFNSSVGRFVGFTEFGVKTAAAWNNDPSIIAQFRAEKDRYCVPNVELSYKSVLSKTAKPYAVLNLTYSSGSERVLHCSAYGFYPKHITVSWTNHHRPITSGVTTTDLLPDSDWYYQVHSHLEYSPSSGDQISCVIEHASLSEPLILDWEGRLSDGDRNKIAIGASGLVLGLVLSLAGFIYYRRKAQGKMSAKSWSGPALVWVLLILVLVLLVLLLHLFLWLCPEGSGLRTFL